MDNIDKAASRAVQTVRENFPEMPDADCEFLGELIRNTELLDECRDEIRAEFGDEEGDKVYWELKYKIGEFPAMEQQLIDARREQSRLTAETDQLSAELEDEKRKLRQQGIDPDEEVE